MFQYSFCSYSTMLVDMDNEIFDCFNTASVLIQHFICSQCPKIYWFQYSFCSYSTCIFKKRFWTKDVSIQLLFLFNFLFVGIRIPDTCFNTASVLIQLCSITLHRGNRKFQYSFCSYSTSKMYATRPY